MTALEHNKTLVIGLGKTGLSCARFLQAQGVPVAVTDSRAMPPALMELREEHPDMAIFLGGFEADVFSAAEQLVVSPGVSISEPLIAEAADRGVPVVGDIELFAKVANAPVVAITGSNGKSTVTTLVGDMLKATGKKVALGGNLGEPALDLLAPDIDSYVLELSSFQLETTNSLSPEVAVVLNVSADHMDRYRDLDHYAETKSQIYRHAKCGVFNLDDPLVKQMAEQFAGAARFFTLGEPAAEQFGLRRLGDQRWLAKGDEMLMPAKEVMIPGTHNLSNVLAALALGELMQLPMPAMLQAVREFKGLQHRTQLVAEIDGVRWFNDSKGTNVGACIAALEGFADDPGMTVLIAGGDGKGADFGPLRNAVLSGVRAVVLIGQDGQRIADAIDDGAPLQFAEELSDAVNKARELAQPGDRVLLSPACASFDMFKSYKDRGERFVELVQRWLQ